MNVYSYVLPWSSQATYLYTLMQSRVAVRRMLGDLPWISIASLRRPVARHWSPLGATKRAPVAPRATLGRPWTPFTLPRERQTPAEAPLGAVCPRLGAVKRYKNNGLAECAKRMNTPRSRAN